MFESRAQDVVAGLVVVATNQASGNSVVKRGNVDCAQLHVKVARYVYVSVKMSEMDDVTLQGSGDLRNSNY